MGNFHLKLLILVAVLSGINCQNFPQQFSTPNIPPFLGIPNQKFNPAGLNPFVPNQQQISGSQKPFENGLHAPVNVPLGSFRNTPNSNPNLAAGGQQPQRPERCSEPFDGVTRSALKNGFPFTVYISHKQVGVSSAEQVEKLRGADILLSFSILPKTTGDSVRGVGISPGVPLPVGDFNTTWIEEMIKKTPELPKDIEVLPCLNAVSKDIFVMQAKSANEVIPEKFNLMLTPFLAAWNNKQTRDVTFNLLILDSNNQVFQGRAKVPITIAESNYKVPQNALPPQELIDHLL